MLTGDDVEHPGVEDGRTDESQEDKAAGGEKRRRRLHREPDMESWDRLVLGLSELKCTLQLWSSWWCCWATSAAQTSADSRR